MSEVAEAVRNKLFEHLFSMGRDIIDIVEVEVFKNAKGGIPEELSNRVLHISSHKRTTDSGNAEPSSGDSSESTSQSPGKTSQGEEESKPY